MHNILTSNGGAIVNAVALVFVVGFALYGLIRGFAKTFISMFGTILSILFAILLSSSVASFLESNYSFVTTVSKSLSGVLTNIFGEEIMNTTIEHAAEETMRNAGLSGLIINLVLSFKSNNSVPTDTTLNQIVCPTFAYYVVLIICAIALFIVIKLVFIVIGNIVKRMHSIKVVAHIDKILGFALGLISGIIYFETIVMLIGAFPIGFLQNLFVIIQESSVAQLICSINPYDSILNLISFNDISKFITLIIN